LPLAAGEAKRRDRERKRTEYERRRSQFMHGNLLLDRASILFTIKGESKSQLHAGAFIPGQIVASTAGVAAV
jgi:hypothetical protein